MPPQPATPLRSPGGASPASQPQAFQTIHLEPAAQPAPQPATLHRRRAIQVPSPAQLRRAIRRADYPASAYRVRPARAAAAGRLFRSAASRSGRAGRPIPPQAIQRPGLPGASPISLKPIRRRELSAMRASPRRSRAGRGLSPSPNFAEQTFGKQNFADASFADASFEDASFPEPSFPARTSPFSHLASTSLDGGFRPAPHARPSKAIDPSPKQAAQDYVMASQGGSGQVPPSDPRRAAAGLRRHLRPAAADCARLDRPMRAARRKTSTRASRPMPISSTRVRLGCRRRAPRAKLATLKEPQRLHGRQRAARRDRLGRRPRLCL